MKTMWLSTHPNCVRLGRTGRLQTPGSAELRGKKHSQTLLVGMNDLCEGKTANIYEQCICTQTAISHLEIYSAKKNSCTLKGSELKYPQDSNSLPATVLINGYIKRGDSGRLVLAPR